jgi:hypothetical protein
MVTDPLPLELWGVFGVDTRCQSVLAGHARTWEAMVKSSQPPKFGG